MTSRLGVAGRLAAAFIPSKLTPLLIAGSIAVGAFAIAALPREEEPQIVVPMVDVFVELPGASPAEVEQRITRPLEKLLWEVPGVEYIYSTSSAGQSMVIVRFLVGEDEERALVRLNQKLAANADRMPPGASPPLVKPRSIDDVPILAVTLWGEGYDDYHLRTLAAQLREALAEVPDVSEVTLIGGRPREIGVRLDPARLAAASLDPVAVLRALEEANTRSTATGPVSGGTVARSRPAGRSIACGARRRGGLDREPPLDPTRRRRPDRRRRCAAGPRAFPRACGRHPSRRDDCGGEAQGRKCHHRFAPGRGKARHRASGARAQRCPGHGHQRLRRDGGREIERAALHMLIAVVVGLAADPLTLGCGNRSSS